MALTDSGEERMNRIIAGIAGTIMNPPKPRANPTVIIPRIAILLFIAYPLPIFEDIRFRLYCMTLVSILHDRNVAFANDILN